MKTPIQEHIEWLDKMLRNASSIGMGTGDLELAMRHAKSMLEKEKRMLAVVWFDAQVAYYGNAYIKPFDPIFDEYYEETFNTKEK